MKRMNPILPIFASVAACVAPAFGQELPVFPKPQQVGVINSMPAGINTPVKKQLLTKDAKVPVEFEQMAARFPKDTFSGAYAMKVSAQGILILAKDERGFFYAEQTLDQLKANAKDGKIQAVEIIDWPDVAFRGTVEGFYGTPWSHKARLSQLRFYGKTKMNTYIYGPKDDPFHSSNWRQPYPIKEAEQIKELVKVAKENHVDFVWAIHPGGSIKWTPEDMGNVIKKFDLMYQLGVRSFAVFFDDIGGEGTNPKSQAELLNMIHKEFIAKKGDCTPLIMCPTEYNRGWANKKPGTYLDILGDELDPSIHVMWTGNSVVHDLKSEGQTWVNKRVKRPTYFWFNWPVTDYVRSYLGMGRLYGQMDAEGDKSLVSGFVSNPMDKPEASKVALFSVADYTWNMKEFNNRSDATWRAGIKWLFPECAEQMQLFCDHASDFSNNGHGYRKEESVQIAPLIKVIRDAVKAGKSIPESEAKQISLMFSNMAKAPEIIRAKANNEDFLTETGPWIQAFGQLGKAGEAILEVAQMPKVDGEKFAKNTLEAVTQLNEMERYKLPHKPRIGSLVLTPCVKELTESAAEKLYSFVSGQEPLKPVVTVQGGKTEGLDKIVDGNYSSSWHSGHYAKEGDWYALNFGRVVPIRSVDLLMGRKDNDSDYVKSGQLEYSEDGSSWKPLGGVTGGIRVNWDGKPVFAKALRYRIIEPMKTGNNTVWTAIREFSINNPPPTKVITNIDGFKKLSAQTQAKLIRVAQVHEVVKMEPGKELGLEFPGHIKTTWVEINAENPTIDKWGEVLVELENSKELQPLKVSKQGNKLVNTNPPAGIKRIVLRNKSSEPQDAKFSMFKVDVPPTDPACLPVSLEDGKITSSYSCETPFSVDLSNDSAPQAKSVSILSNAEFKLSARDSKGEWKVLGNSSPEKSIQTWDLPKGGASALRMESAIAQPGKYIHEVIYK